LNQKENHQLELLKGEFGHPKKNWTAQQILGVPNLGLSKSMLLDLFSIVLGGRKDTKSPNPKNGEPQQTRSIQQTCPTCSLPQQRLKRLKLQNTHTDGR